MNNKIVIAIVAVVVVAAGAWFFISRGGVVAPGQVVKNPESIAAALAAGSPLKCTIAPTEENNEMTGTFYIANGKTRGDFTGMMEGRYNGGHMIVDGRMSYTWFDGQTSGFKMTAQDVEVKPGESQPLPSGPGFDPNQEMGFTCEGWSVDPTRFIVPTQIDFVDMSRYSTSPEPTGIPSVTGGAAAGTSAQCAICDQVPDAAARAQCKTSLGCK